MGDCIYIGRNLYATFQNIGVLSAPGEGEYLGVFSYNSNGLIDWGYFRQLGIIFEDRYEDIRDGIVIEVVEYIVYECIQGTVRLSQFIFIFIILRKVES